MIISLCYDCKHGSSTGGTWCDYYGRKTEKNVKKCIAFDPK